MKKKVVKFSRVLLAVALVMVFSLCAGAAGDGSGTNSGNFPETIVVEFPKGPVDTFKKEMRTPEEIARHLWLSHSSYLITQLESHGKLTMTFVRAVDETRAVYRTEISGFDFAGKYYDKRHRYDGWWGMIHLETDVNVNSGSFTAEGEYEFKKNKDGTINIFPSKKNPMTTAPGLTMNGSRYTEVKTTIDDGTVVNTDKITTNTSFENIQTLVTLNQGKTSFEVYADYTYISRTIRTYIDGRNDGKTVVEDKEKKGSSRKRERIGVISCTVTCNFPE